MRLSQFQIESIKNAGNKYLTGFQIFLYGSRTDDNKKGGDIDLMILGDRKITIDEQSMFIEDLLLQIGEQKIDIASFEKKSENTFYKIIKLEAIEL